MSLKTTPSICISATTTLALAGALLAGCAAPQHVRYTLPPGTQDTAVLVVNPGTSGRNSAQGLKFRDAPACSPLSLPLVPKTTEGPGRDLARSTSEATEDLRLAVPAAQPIGLRYWVAEVDKSRHWDLVVVLAPGKTYRVVQQGYKDLLIHDVETGLPPMALPHNHFHLALTCP